MECGNYIKKICKSDWIQVFLEPEEQIGEKVVIPITRVRMTCGGGLGGASWYELIERFDNLPTNTIITVKNAINGKEIQINTTYVVNAENLELARLPIKSVNSDQVESWQEINVLVEPGKGKEFRFIELRH